MWKLTAVLFLVCLFSACTKKDTGPQNVFRFPIESEPSSLDWTMGPDHVNINILASIQVGLANMDANLQLSPAIAERWEISPDGKVYTFYLRDAKWSDGVPVTAQDFVYSWQRTLNPKQASPYAYFLFDILNAQKYNEGKITNVEEVGIKALNEKTFQVTLAAPAAYFIYVAAYPLTFPMRKDSVESHPTNFTEPMNLRSTGPYRLTEWIHDSKLTLEPNPYYFGEKPKIAKIVLLVVKEDSTALNLYERGELDATVRLPSLELDRLKKLPDYRKLPHLREVFIGFNTKVAPFNNPLVRKAFGHAIDREALNAVMKSSKLPTKTWIPTDFLGNNPKLGLDFNPELAKKLLAQAGFPNGLKFPKTTYLYDSVEAQRMVAEKLQFQWKQVLNVDIEVQTQEWKVYLDTLKHSPPGIFKFSWSADYPDPHTFMSLFDSNSGWNTTNWKNPTYDASVKKAMATLDRGQREKEYDKAQSMLLEQNAVIVPLYQETIEALVKPYVENFTITPLDSPLFGKASIAGAPALPPTK